METHLSYYETQPGLRVPAAVTSYTMTNKKIMAQIYYDRDAQQA